MYGGAFGKKKIDKAVISSKGHNQLPTTRFAPCRRDSWHTSQHPQQHRTERRREDELASLEPQAGAIVHWLNAQEIPIGCTMSCNYTVKIHVYNIL